jgi:hypothetical protein
MTSIFSTNPQTLHFYYVKISQFSPISKNYFFSEYSPSFDLVSFFFLFIHHKEENKVTLFIGEVSILNEFIYFYSILFFIAIFQKIQKLCQICIRIMFK